MDPEVNFYEVQESFNAHWGDKGYERGKGWKQYKRWEYHTAPRSFPNGVRGHSKEYFEAWQKVEKMNQFQPKSNSSWQPVGPTSWVSQGWNPGLGRVNAIVEDPNNSNIIYVATPSGGLWKSVNSGTDWVCLTDDLPAIGASGIAINPDNSDILYLATGDGDGSDTYSFGVMKSVDGGVSWEPTSLIHELAQQVRCTKIVMDPDNYDKLWVSTNKGLFITEDAGLSWTQTLTGDIRDIKLRPGDSQTVYCSGRKFYKSTDGGQNFTHITEGTPLFEDVNRLAIAVSADDPEVVYMLAGSNANSGFYGLYRSTDSGESFELRSNSPNILTHSEIGEGEGGQSWYDLAIAASPTNASEVYVGGINVWKSINGGMYWSIKSHWVHPSSIGYTHADIHSLDFYGDKLYCGSDGGIFKSADNGNSWTDLSDGLQISQFYKIAVSTTNPGKILTASQDNGTNLFTTEAGYKHLLGGDGNMALIDYSDDQIMYSAYPGGSFQKSTDGGFNFSDYTNGIDETGGWVTPLEIHPSNPNILYAAFENVWRAGSSGIWERISDFPFSGTLQTLKVSPSDPDVIYTSSYEKIQKTSNAGETWSAISSGLPNLAITDIEVHPTNPDRVWLTMSGYEANSKVFYSENGGSTWQNITTNLPNIPANCISYQLGSNDGLYIGTDAGVYYRDADNLNWNGYNTGLPNVIIKQIIFQYQASKVIIGTYGRGVWENEFFDPSNLLPVIDFKATPLLGCMGQEVQYTNNSINVDNNFVWTFEGGTPSESTEINPTVTYNQSGNFSAKLWAANDNGQDSLIISNYIQIIDTTGMTVPYTEDFESASSVYDIPWFVESESNNTWKINHEIGYNSNSSIWINNNSKPPLHYDYLYSSTFDLSDLDTAVVTMRVAYARKPSSSTESIKVYVSNDCGDTWTFKKTFNSTSTLSSADPTTMPFIPADSTEWNLLTVDNIQPHERTSNFRMQIRFSSNGGNNIYLDDINILKVLPTYLEKRKPIFESVKMYPNPAADHTTLKIFAQNTVKATVNLHNIEGKHLGKLWDGKINAGENSIQLSLKGMAAGIYTLSIQTDAGIQSKQLVIEE